MFVVGVDQCEQQRIAFGCGGADGGGEKCATIHQQWGVINSVPKSVPEGGRAIPIAFEQKRSQPWGMKITELTAEETKVIELLRAHPAVAGQVEAVLAVMRAGGEGPGTIGAAEERLVEPLRMLGLNVLGGWAQRAEARSGAQAQAADPSLRVRRKKKRRGTAATAPSR